MNKQTWEERFDEFGELFSFPLSSVNMVLGYKLDQNGSNTPINGKCDTEIIKMFIEEVRQQTAKEIFDMIDKWDDSDIVDEKEVFIDKKSLLKVISQKYLKGHKEK